MYKLLPRVKVGFSERGGGAMGSPHIFTPGTPGIEGNHLPIASSFLAQITLWQRSLKSSNSSSEASLHFFSKFRLFVKLVKIFQIFLFFQE
jgi:hypothetical protein